MNETTVAQAIERAQVIEQRAALRVEAADVGLNNKRIAKIAQRSNQLVSAWFKGDADSKRLERIIRREIAKRRAKAAKKETAA